MLLERDPIFGHHALTRSDQFIRLEADRALQAIRRDRKKAQEAVGRAAEDG